MGQLKPYSKMLALLDELAPSSNQKSNRANSDPTKYQVIVFHKYGSL